MMHLNQMVKLKKQQIQQNYADICQILNLLHLNKELKKHATGL
jgi:hypothetical protein